MTHDYWTSEWELRIDKVRTMISYIDDETQTIEERYDR